MAGIYIHIPFCKQACYYCDFHFSTNQKHRAEMLVAINHELRLRKDYLHNEVIETIYFGGGTPSLLVAEELEGLMETIRSTHTVIDNPEISLEANPDDLTKDKLNQLHSAGINRLSIGIQSFEDGLLKFLHRAHDATAAKTCISLAREAGFKNISLDLIYAIPSQDDQMWISDIQQALTLAPEHISCYSLTLEEKTVFGRWNAAGKFKATEDEVAARQLEILMDYLINAGYEHYEISNFAKPGFHSRHNSSYWRQTQYLGVGPSAHSYNSYSRQFNISNNSLYVKAINTGEVPFEKEVLTDEDRVNEYILTTLRTQWGTDLKKLITLYNYDLLNDHKLYLSSLMEKDLATLEGGVLRLTRKGKLLADKISSDLFILQS